MPTPPSKKPTKRAAKPRMTLDEKAKAALGKALLWEIDARTCRTIRRAVRLARAAGFAKGIEKAAKVVDDKADFWRQRSLDHRADSESAHNYREHAGLAVAFAAEIRKATPDAK